MSAHILIVDDENDIRSLLKEILEDEGYRASEAAHSEAALSVLNTDLPNLIILDIWLDNSDMDGMEILEHVKNTYPEIPVLMISGHGNIEMAVKAMKLGAYEFIEKPFNSDRLLLLIERALETNKLLNENQDLKRKIDIFDSFTAVDPKSLAVKQEIEKIAPTNSRVMVYGASGVGKTLIARAMHDASLVASGPFVLIECASLSAKSEAEQKAVLEKSFEQAQGGSCVLQNIQEIPRNMQGYLAHLLQNNQQESTQCRIISTGTPSVKDDVEQGRFKEDLYYRLNVSQVEVPCLRNRKQDIGELAMHYLRKFYQAKGKEAPKIQDDALLVLQKFSWPGNVRQLKNTIENVAMTHINTFLPAIRSEHLPAEVKGYLSNDVTAQQQGNGQGEDNTSPQDLDITSLMASWMGLPLKEARGFFEKYYLDMQTEHFDGNISKIAEHIGMERTALHRKLKALSELSYYSDGHANKESDNENNSTTRRVGS